MNGPFLIERPIKLLGLYRQPIPADHNKPVRVFVFRPRLAALGHLAPRRRQLLPATAGFRLAGATTVRMIDRIARHATADAANAPMPRPASLAQNHIFVLRVANLADGRIALLVEFADFT